MLRTGRSGAEIEVNVQRRKYVQQPAWFCQGEDSSIASVPRLAMKQSGSRSELTATNLKHSGRSRARRRLARKPKLRMRMKPHCSRWRRNRRSRFQR